MLPLPRWFDPLPAPTPGPPLTRFGGGSGPPPVPAVFLTGSIDPNDSSHVIIPYMLLESYTAIARRTRSAIAPASASASTLPTITDIQGNPIQVTAQGELDVYLQNDDSLRFALRGPGQLPTTRMAADPTSLLQAAAASRRGLAQALAHRDVSTSVLS